MSIVAKIEELFKNPSELSQDKMNVVIKDVLECLNDLKGRLVSEDPEVRKAALEAATKMQEELQEQTKSLCKSIGVNPEKLSDYFANAQEKMSMEDTQLGVAGFNDALKALQAGGSENTGKKKPKRVKEWLAS